ncbi:t-SNARE [Gongronella butleri]|nr:t-SNARE [Gongronella butleri]
MSFTRDRTAELRGSFEGTQNNDGFGPNRTPMGYNGYQRSAYQTPPPMASQPYETAIEMTPTHNIDSMQGFFDEISSLKEQLRIINSNIDEIEQVHNAALVSFNEEQWAQFSSNLDRLKDNTQKRNQELKARIKALDVSNAPFPNDSNGASRRNQTNNIKNQFKDAILRYQTIEQGYQKKYRERIERQIRIVKPEATQQEINAIIDTDDSQQIFAQSLVQQSRRGQARAVLSEVESRNNDIKKINKTIMELAQLFEDLQMLIENQGQVVNQVEEHAQTTADHVKQANTQLDRAIATAKSIRHKKWCCFFICIILAVVIAILVWWFGFNHPGVKTN